MDIETLEKGKVLRKKLTDIKAKFNKFPNSPNSEIVSLSISFNEKGKYSKTVAVPKKYISTVMEIVKSAITSERKAIEDEFKAL